MAAERSTPQPNQPTNVLQLKAQPQPETVRSEEHISIKRSQSVFGSVKPESLKDENSSDLTPTFTTPRNELSRRELIPSAFSSTERMRQEGLQNDWLAIRNGARAAEILGQGFDTVSDQVRTIGHAIVERWQKINDKVINPNPRHAIQHGRHLKRDETPQADSSDVTADLPVDNIDNIPSE